jgi:hypothetical protein
MPKLIIEILRYVDDHFPGWVECKLVDALSQEHLFVEKAPMVTSAYLGPESSYPQSGVIACEQEAQWVDESARKLVLVSTERPWGVESTTHLSNFVVLQAQLISDEENS